jgi:hypothetical protein
MKCEVCLELLEEYLDGELAAESKEQIGGHLITCAECSASFSVLTAEQELFARYDREIEVPPFLWTRVAAHTVSENKVAEAGWRSRVAVLFGRPLAAVVAILLFAIAVGLAYMISKRQPAPQRMATTPHQRPIDPPKTADKQAAPTAADDRKRHEVIASGPKAKPRLKRTISNRAFDQSDVLSSDFGYLDMDDQDTAKHIEQTQNLLRSIKNVAIADGDDEIDVTYDKALSRRLLNENVVLRRDAEMKAKFPTKTLLADLEPFLIDIANLPDNARAEDLRVIRERVQKTEIVAALVDYQDRSKNNR